MMRIMREDGVVPILTDRTTGARYALLVLALLTGGAATGYLTLYRQETQLLDENRAYDFLAFDPEEEEDFASSPRSAVNQIELPNPYNWEKTAYNAMNPTMILIVGPIETGISQLDAQLRATHEDLFRDNYVVADNQTSQALHTTCQLELNQVRMQYDMKTKKRGKLSEKLAAVPCWRSFLEKLKVLEASSSSFIISDEWMSQQLADYHGIGPAVLDWLSLRETIPNWNVQVVVGYRRFYEWILAAKAAEEKIHLQQHTSLPPKLARWPGHTRERGMLLEPLFPHFIQDAVKKLDVPDTKRIKEMFEPYVQDLQILNVHKPPSMRTEFVCNILKNAATACAESQNHEEEDSRIELELDGDWADYQLLDELVTTAAQRNFIRYKHVTRITATETTQYYVEKRLRKTAHQLPLSCPDQTQLDRFLKDSQKYEQEIAPDFYKNGGGSKQLRDNFRSLVKQKVFCSLNMRQVLRERQWRQFFRHLTNQSAQRIQAGGEPGPVRYLRGSSD
jgi:hypothetical protein